LHRRYIASLDAAAADQAPFDFWCSFWIYSGVVVMCVYGVAFYLLTHPPRYGIFANLIFLVSVFLWSIVL